MANLIHSNQDQRLLLGLRPAYYSETAPHPRPPQSCPGSVPIGLLLAAAAFAMAVTLGHATPWVLPPSVTHWAAAPRTDSSAAPATFEGQWQMDLKASDRLGPLLRELGLNRVLAAVITRLPVRQSIAQDADAVSIRVQTRVSDEAFQLRLDGAVSPIPGVTGGRTAAVSRWLDGARLETRQLLDDRAAGRPDDPDADVFVTVRSLQDGGDTLLEDCSVVRGGGVVPAAVAKRYLRRCSARATK